jgi:hypothetical protein
MTNNENGIKGWVYYVPERETLCICWPQWVNDRGDRIFEWGGHTLAEFRDIIYLDARESSDMRNCIYIGEL